MENKLIRIQKFLSHAGIASRRKSEELIKEGKVRVRDLNKSSDFSIAKIGDKIDPEKDQIFMDGKQIMVMAEHIYYAVNKPVGYTSSVRDVNAKKLVTDLVPKIPKVWPVGRLDRDSTGLIILTNDGELTNLLTHPRYRHHKEYLVKIQIPNDKNQTPVVETYGFTTGQVNPKSQIQKLKNRILLTEGWARFDKFEIIDIDEKLNTATIKVELHQGWKRQIRRMCEKVGLLVLELKRTCIAKLQIEDLKEGEYRLVKKSDII